MPDPAEQLQQLYAAGFTFQTFERFANAVGVVRGDVIVLVQPTPEGLRMLGAPGWRMGEVMGVLVESGGHKVFRYKEQEVEATEERLTALREFREALERVIG